MPSYCFETPFLKSHFPIENAFSFDEMVEELSGTRPAESANKTIALLRESLILTPEHIAHCFSVLPQTPKNQKLQSDLVEYIQTEGPRDRTAVVWALIGLLKEKKFEQELDPHWIFVKDSDSSLLFTEFAKAISYVKGVETVELKSLGSLFPNPNSEKGIIYHGSASDSLKALSERIETEIQTAPKVYVTFHGSDDERAFLSLLLASKGILLPIPREYPPSFFSLLRYSRELTLERRLTLWHEFKRLKNGSLGTVPDEEIIDRLDAPEKGLLLSFLGAASPLSISPTKSPVVLLPWLSLPATDAPVLAFAGETLFEFDTSDLELTAPELEALFQAGFPLPRPSEHRRSRLAVLEELTQMGRPVFTSLDTANLKDAQDHAPKGEDFSVSENKPKFQIALPRYSYSATQLETYATCPTKYLLGNRLKLRPDPTGMDALPLLNGQITHKALELHFLEKGTLLESFEKALKETAPQLALNHPMARSLRFQFQKVIPGILSLEKELDALFGRRTPKYFEKEFEIQLNGSTFRGKIDRIDELSDGSLLILDYKTGNIDFTPEHIRKGSHFQALLYLLGTEALFSVPVAGMLFYDLKNTEVRRGILIEERVSKEAKKAITRGHTLSLEKYHALIASGVEQTGVLCKKIESGNFDPTPSAENCAYCDFATYCRSAYGIV